MTFDQSEPPAHFPLSLGAFDLDMDDVVLPAVAIHIQPDGDDRWMFEYAVTFFFTEPNGIPKEVHFNSSRDGLRGIILDQDNRTHYGILAEAGLPPAAPHPDTDAVLDRVTLEFATYHDDKKADTKLNVHIVNRISASVVQDIAIGVDLLPGKRFADDGPLANRRDRVSWSASVTDNPLASPDIRLADIVLPVVYVIIDPPGHDKWNFDYEVTYEFVDAKNADGKRHVFSSRTNGVVLDQDHPKHEGVYQGAPFPTVVPATAPPLTVQPVGRRGKPLPLSFLQLKIDEFLGRGGPLDSDAPALLQLL